MTLRVGLLNAARQLEGSAATISQQLPLRRRRLGLALVGLGVFALAAQSWMEWLLPYDLALLDAVRHLVHSHLGATALVWLWALLCAVLLLVLARAGPRPTLAAVEIGRAHV